MQILTDQEFLYRQSPTEEDGLAKITDIKGNTIVWNQLYQNTNIPTSQTKNGVTITNNNDGSWTLSGTASADTYFYGLNGDIKPIIGHKYLMKDCVPSGVNRFYCIFNGVSIDVAQNNIIATATSSTSGGTAFQILSGATVNVTFRPQIFDLTQMFGVGNEPATVEEFTSFFSLPYYAYNQGSLLSFMGNGIKTVGKNLFDENSVLLSQGFVKQNDGSYYKDNLASLANVVVWSNDAHINGAINTEFKYKNINTTGSGGLRIVIIYTDGARQIVYNSLASEFTLKQHQTNPSKTVDNIVWDYGSSINSTYIKDFIISVDNISYEPYTSSTLSLPISTYFPNGMKKAGSVYDELTENKAITRIGAVDLGSLNWSYLTSGSALAPYFVALFYEIKSQGNPARNKANIICSKYQTVARNETDFVDKTICADGSSTSLGQIQIKDSSYADATALKNSLQGVYLYYELKTPTETSFTTASLVTENPQGLVYPPQSKEEYPFFKSYKCGTEQLLPENSSVPVTAPIICDLMYSSGAIQVTTYPNPEQGGETSGDGWYLVGEEATVNALPNEHYAFNNWVLDGEIVSTDPEYTFEVKDE